MVWTTSLAGFTAALVALGQLTDTSVTVLKGLTPAEHVAISSVNRLRNGMAVKRAAS
jgi:hypothetical protein